MHLSIVTTLYKSAPTLEEFYRRLTSLAEQITTDFEIILVHDGSPDNTLDVALALYETDARVRVIDLSRNFGAHKSMMTGLRYARGDLVFLTDCDLGEEPELLTEFYRRMQETGADVVYGVQKWRTGGWVERLGESLFFSLFNLLSEHKLPANVVATRLMTRRYVDDLLEHRERETTLGGLFVITGYEQVAVPIVKRATSRSSYDFGRKTAQFVNAVTSFSDRPLVFIFYLGVFISLVSGVYALRLVVRKIFFGIAVPGWPSLIVSIWLLGGLTLLSLGVIGIYLSKIFLETKRRPLAVVRRRYERQAGGQAAAETSALSREAPAAAERAAARRN